MIVNEKATLALTPAAAQSDAEGYFVEVAGSTVAVCNSAADLPLGLIIDGEPTTGKSTIALSGAYPGIVTVKLGATPGAVVLGAYGVLNADGTVKLDPGTGARVRVCRFLEAGVAGELVWAVLTTPTALT